MTDMQFDDPLKELEAALAIEPSSAFAARVRARVAETRNRPMWLGWQGLAALAAMALAVLGTVLWQARVGEVRTLPHRAAETFADTAVPVVAEPPFVARATAAAEAPIDVPRVRTAAARVPEVLVPADQAVALNRLLAAMRERRTAGVGAAEAPTVVIEELPQISPVRLEPIRIDPLVPSSPPSGGKEKDR